MRSASVWFSGWLFLIAVLVTGEARQVCRRDCIGYDCPSVECLHGQCSDDGQCVCYPCWKGAACGEFRNNHVPRFMNDHVLTVTPSALTSAGDGIVQVLASDEDISECDDDNCPCGEIQYGIESGNERSLFSIDSHTGQISAVDSLLGHDGEIYRLVVSAINALGDEKSNIEVMVKIDEGGAEYSNWLRGQEKYRKPHIRHKRAAPNTPLTSEVVPIELTFYLAKTGDYENVTDMYVGSKIHFQLQIHVPVGTMDILVELFTPDNDTTVMVICQPAITHVGGSLDQSINAIVPELESKDGSTEYDRVIIDFGNVTNGGGAATTDNMVYVDWDVIMIDNDDTSDGHQYWVSAGAEYNNEEEIWVGQASFTVHTTDNMVPDAPTFNTTWPDTMEVGTFSVFRTDMYIHHPSADLVFEVLAPINTSDYISLSALYIADTGANYECLDKSPLPSLTGSGSWGKDYGTLNIGTATNKGSREATVNEDDHRITVEFIIYTLDDDAAIGETDWIGAALNIGAEQLWVAQIPVTLSARTMTLTMTGTPVLTLTDVSGPTVNVGSPAEYRLDMVLPAPSESDFKLEILMPYNNTARGKVCMVEMIEQGINVLHEQPLIPEYSSRDETSLIFEKGEVDIGVVKNIGIHSTTDYPTANTISFRFYVQIVEHPLNGAGETLLVTAGMEYDTVTDIWVGQSSLIAGPANTSTETPDFDLSHSLNTDGFPIGAVGSVKMVIRTLGGLVYNPVNLEVVLPFNDTAGLSLCRVEVMSVGANLPCSNQPQLNDTITYKSRSNDTTMDRAVLNFGSLCNMGNNTVATEDDEVVINIAFKMEDHINHVDGTKNWVSVGILFAESRLWVGQLAAYTLKDQSPIDLPSGLAFNTSVARYSNTTGDVAAGMSVAYRLMVKVPSLSLSECTISAWTTAPQLKVCHLRIVESGYGIPCVNMSLEATYTLRAGSEVNERADLNITISNVVEESPVDDVTFDNVTIVFEVIIGVDLTAADGSYTFNFDVDHGRNGVDNKEVVTIDVGNLGVPNDTADMYMPTIAYALTNFTDKAPENEIADGEAKTFQMDITVANNSQNKMIVKFIAPSNETDFIEICSANVIFVGKNMPCLVKESLEAVFRDRPGSSYSLSHYADLELGYVCHFDLSDDPVDNKIIIEAVGRLIPLNTADVGVDYWFGSAVRINDDQIFVGQVALRKQLVADFLDSSYNASALSIVLNGSAVQTGINEEHVSLFTITVPANCTARGSLKVTSPLDQSAVMTIVDVKLLSGGANVACMKPDRDFYYPPLLTSTLNTSQTDTCEIDLQVVTNTGHTYRANRYEPEDDTFECEVTWRMADSVTAVEGSSHNLEVEFTLGSTTVSAQQEVQVVRDEREDPELLLEVTVDSSPIYNVGDVISFNVSLTHSNLSTAEAYNVTALFYYPPYLQFVEITNKTFNRVDDTISITNVSGQHGIAIFLETFYFTDILTFTAELRLVAHVPEDGGQATSFVVFDVSSQAIYRTGHVNSSGTVFVTRLNQLQFQVMLPATVEVTQCTAVPLGLSNNILPDCQISGSYSPLVNNQPNDVRYGGSSGWVPATRGRAFRRYIQVALGNVTVVSAVALEHPSPNIGVRIAEFIMMYSDDGITWVEGDTVTPTGSYSTELIELPTRFEGRFVRLVVTEPTDVTVALKVEFHGCVRSSDTSVQQMCVQDPWMTGIKKAFFTRSVLEPSTGTFYFCDRNPEQDDRVRCYSSVDGFAWTAMDRRLGGLKGYHPTTGRLYGISTDQRAYLSSDDQGITWNSVPDSAYLDAVADTGYVAAVEIPPINVGLTPGASVASGSFTYGTWGVNYEGVYKGAQVADWTECCV